MTPIGPTWDPAHYFLGADNQGRDVAARLLYGGRNSLLIGFFAALITCLLATAIGLVAGFFGGLLDGVISRGLDIVWAFPVFLFAISLSTILMTQGLAVGPFRLEAGSLLLPIAIIGVVYIPYVARPIRGEVLSLRRREFVEAAIGLGASTRRLLWSDILPNVVTTVIVFFPLVMALAMLTEAALSFLSIGVQPPDASWGTIIQDGDELIRTRPGGRDSRPGLRSRSPCSRSTSSATGSATRSTRARSSGELPLMLRLVARRPGVAWCS